MPPTPRPDVFDAYWRFAANRHAIFERRLDGCPPPWTDDPILERYKFCNTYRAVDRVSQFLLSRVIYNPDAEGLRPEDVFLRIVLFRLFSKEATWEALESGVGLITRSTLDVESCSSILERRRAKHPIYTSAFILAPPATSNGLPKHVHHLRLVERMFAPSALGAKLARATRLRDIVESLLEWPTIGPFLAYQIAIDLNYSPYFGFDENEFTLPGPGALRGVAKVFSDTGGLGTSDLIHYMVRVQDEQFDRLGLRFGGLFGRPLHAIDCQGLFCETDKYSRVAFPELRSARSRIKHEFRVTGPLARPVLPPHWRLSVVGPPAVTGAAVLTLFPDDAGALAAR